MSSSRSPTLPWSPSKARTPTSIEDEDEDRNMPGMNRSVGRTVHLFNTSDRNSTVGGLILTNGVTNSLLYSMVEVIVVVTSDFTLKTEDDTTIPKDGAVQVLRDAGARRDADDGGGWDDDEKFVTRRGFLTRKKSGEKWGPVHVLSNNESTADVQLSLCLKTGWDHPPLSFHVLRFWPFLAPSPGTGGTITGLSRELKKHNESTVL